MLATVVLMAIGMAATTWWGPDMLGKSGLAAPARPLGNAGRGPAPRAPGPQWPVHAAHRPDRLSRRRPDPRSGRRRHQRRRTGAGGSGRAERGPWRVAARRALCDRYLRRGAVRRRLDRRAAGGDPAAAGRARRGGGGGPVERLGAMGPSRGRRGGGTAAVRNPGAVRFASRAICLAHRGGDRRSAAGAARAAGRAGGPQAEAAARLPGPGRRPGRAAAGGGRGSELECHHQGGDQPAQLAEPSITARPGRRWPRS